MWPEDPARVRPMLASIGEVPLASAEFAYEPKYDGIRALVAIEPGAASPRVKAPARVRIWSRLGNDKTRQFPDITTALSRAFAGVKTSLLVDGEVVALDAEGQPTTFLRLQGRIHAREASDVEALSSVAFIAFDLLMDGRTDLRQSTLDRRRVRLERTFSGRTSATVRLSEQVVGDGRTLLARAHDENWEGLIAKRVDSRYASSKRSPDWRKIKLVRHQTCVIGGWTAPRGTRQRFGALLLGVFDDSGQLQHAGQVGTGFSGPTLDVVWKRLQEVQTKRAPFASVPRSLQRSHWVEPSLVCEVKFTEWTLDNKLRHPTFLGLRDDVKPATVKREPQSSNTPRQTAEAPRPRRTTPVKPRSAREPEGAAAPSAATPGLVEQIDAIEGSGGNGVLALPGGARLNVTNLGKVLWPRLKLTKGDLFRHYVRVASAILPVLAGRPLVMKRYPNGVEAKPFYQHRAADRVPIGVDVAMVESSDGQRSHLIGGSLIGLLYTCQLAAISQDPWFSTVTAPDAADSIAIDLDPPEHLPFRRVLDVALRVRDELGTLGAEAFPKTSGSTGVHIFVPLPRGTPYQAALLYAQIVATMVAKKYPRHATVERSIAARGKRVYVDYMQNMRGKTLASAYSVRANEWAGVSTPLTWAEVEHGVSPADFTMPTFGQRLTGVGDLWSRLRRATPADLRAVMKYAEP